MPESTYVADTSTSEAIWLRANAAAGKSHRIQRLRSAVHAGVAGGGSPEVSQPSLLVPTHRGWAYNPELFASIRGSCVAFSGSACPERDPGQSDDADGDRIHPRQRAI